MEASGALRPRHNVLGTRLKAAIQEAGNVSTAIGLVSQNASLDPDKFAGVWAISGTYGAFTPLMYTPRVCGASRIRTARSGRCVAHPGWPLGA